MLLVVRTEQWRVHHLARGIPSNQRTPQTTCQSRSHDGQPDAFRSLFVICELLRFNNKKIGRIGATGEGPTGPHAPSCAKLGRATALGWVVELSALG